MIEARAPTPALPAAADGEIRRELAVDAAVLGVAAGLIHAIAAVGHTDYWPFAAFFALLAVAQLVWGVLIYRRAARRVLLVGAWGNAAVALLWLLTRTVGLPIGPHAGGPESVGALDVLATLDEQAIVVLLLVLLRWDDLSRRVVHAAGRAGPVLGIGLTVASLVSLTLGVHAH
jgi:hypothetical protein